MKTVRDKMIKERIRIDQCQKGDRLRGDVGPSKYSYTSIILEKIKSVGKGRVQIKYRHDWRHTSVIQKNDVDASLIVERTRKATAADVPGAGEVVRDQFEHKGILYHLDDEDEKNETVTVDSSNVEILDPLPKTTSAQSTNPFADQQQNNNSDRPAVMIGLDSFLDGDWVKARFANRDKSAISFPTEMKRIFSSDT